ncbi:MAG: hypothetical protein BroJett011_22570 [Chloroflexota bacterium]|nr:MAG: hypothetical protein BroJett011_22570 [Chloroflexota bacterium]
MNETPTQPLEPAFRLRCLGGWLGLGVLVLYASAVSEEIFGKKRWGVGPHPHPLSQWERGVAQRRGEG